MLEISHGDIVERHQHSESNANMQLTTTVPIEFVQDITSGTSMYEIPRNDIE